MITDQLPATAESAVRLMCVQLGINPSHAPALLQYGAEMYKAGYERALKDVAEEMDKRMKDK